MRAESEIRVANSDLLLAIDKVHVFPDPIVSQMTRLPRPFGHHNGFRRNHVLSDRHFENFLSLRPVDRVVHSVESHAGYFASIT